MEVWRNIYLVILLSIFYEHIFSNNILTLTHYVFNDFNADPTPSMGVLNWNSRLNIIDGILKGIQYLHEDSRLKIFHCDLKPENILLDSNMTPKISDFGISKFFDVNQTRECTTINIVGTRYVLYFYCVIF